jgi:hypothetical protein
MYKEFFHYIKPILCQKSIWKDGELWTSFVGGIISYFWFQYDPGVLVRIHQHFGDLLTVTSIIFGFALSALLFYIQAAGAWSNDENVKNVATKVINWHVWTIICMLFLIGYTLLLWSIGRYLNFKSPIAFILFSLLTFQILYCGFQILNHSLTVLWSFNNRDRLNGSKK